jgi:hypothetical protein
VPDQVPGQIGHYKRMLVLVAISTWSSQILTISATMKDIFAFAILLLFVFAVVNLDFGMLASGK